MSPTADLRIKPRRSVNALGKLPYNRPFAKSTLPLVSSVFGISVVLADARSDSDIEETFKDLLALEIRPKPTLGTLAAAQ